MPEERKPKSIAQIVAEAFGPKSTPAPAVEFPPRPVIHQHDLVLLAAQPGQQRRPFEDGHTIVVYGCADCEWVESHTIDGIWTETQLTALHRQPPTPESPDAP
jgi:hypothetical protein